MKYYVKNIVQHTNEVFYKLLSKKKRVFYKLNYYLLKKVCINKKFIEKCILIG